MTVEEWINKNITLECHRFRTKMHPNACIIFQNRHDPESVNTWKTGEYVKVPHVCAGCEHHVPRDQRDTKLGERKRLPPSIQSDAQMSQKALRQMKTVEVECPGCHLKRFVGLARTSQPSFKANGGLCRKCAPNPRRTNKIDKSQKITIECPGCHEKREITVGETRRKRFTGLCKSCGQMVKNGGVRERRGRYERRD